MWVSSHCFAVVVVFSHGSIVYTSWCKPKSGTFNAEVFVFMTTFELYVINNDRAKTNLLLFTV